MQQRPQTETESRDPLVRFPLPSGEIPTAVGWQEQLPVAAHPSCSDGNSRAGLLPHLSIALVPFWGVQRRKTAGAEAGPAHN